MKVILPESLDRTIEIEVAKRRLHKKDFVEQLIRAGLKQLQPVAKK